MFYLTSALSLIVVIAVAAAALRYSLPLRIEANDFKDSKVYCQENADDKYSDAKHNKLTE